jgi:hypothetical protein
MGPSLDKQRNQFQKLHFPELGAVSCIELYAHSRESSNTERNAVTGEVVLARTFPI